MGLYKIGVRPLLDRMDSETWHIRVREMLHLAEHSSTALKLVEWIGNGGRRFTDPRLRVDLGGIKSESPVWLGPGVDKEGRAVRAWYCAGFAGVEVGAVLPRPQAGQKKPRQFAKGGVALNRLDFNSSGAKAVSQNIDRYYTHKGGGIPIGINIGKNADTLDDLAPDAYAEVADELYGYAAYFVVNVSSPNTPGLRNLQEKEPLRAILRAVNGVMDRRGRRRPLFVKIAPDLTYDAVDDVIDVVFQERLAGIVATNTTINKAIKGKYGWGDEQGGLSGDDEDFRRMATKMIAHIWRRSEGRLEIIGVGGVKDAFTALEKIKAGAKVVQVVTAIRGEGPWVASQINRGLAAFMSRNGVKNISELAGTEAHKVR